MKRLLVLTLILTTLAAVAATKKEKQVIEIPKLEPVTTVGTALEIPEKEVQEIPIVTEEVPEKVIEEVPEEVIEEVIEEVVEEIPVSLGEFKLTAYCACKKCCGKWAEYCLTSSGTVPEQGKTVAADKKVLKPGTTVVINGHEYIVEDTGVKGKHIDIFFYSHQEALEFGVQYAEVFVKEN